MKFSWAAFFIFLAVLTHGLTELAGVSPPSWIPWEHRLGLALAALGGLKAFYVNPDGTSAKVAWEPKQ